jgi:hypothetical protein
MITGKQRILYNERILGVFQVKYFELIDEISVKLTGNFSNEKVNCK